MSAQPAPASERGHWIVPFLVRAALNVAAIWAADELLSGVQSNGELSTYVIAGLALAAINSLVRPVVVFLAIPLIVLTLGIAYLLVSVAMIGLVSWLVPDFSVDGFWSAVGAAIIVFLVNWALSAVLGLEGGRRRDARAR
jgi:putative membrane protein